MVPVARRNLLAEKGRFAISVAGVAFAVLLIMIIVALYRGFSGAGAIIEALPADLWAVQRGTTDPFHSVSLISVESVEGLSQVDEVAAVTPVLARQMSVLANGAKATVFLLALAVPDPTLADEEVQARYLPPRGEVYIDEIVARKSGLRVGDSILAGDTELTVSRVAEGGSDVLVQSAFVNFEDAKEIFGAPGTVNFALLTLSSSADPAAAVATIASADPTLSVLTPQAFIGTLRKEIDETFLPVLALLTFIGLVVGAAMVALTIYTATIERSREYALLKAVGASGGYLYRIVLAQSAMLTAAGFVVGAMGAQGVARLASRASPEFATDFLWLDAGAVLIAATLMSVLASFVPVRRINSIDPAMVFRA